MWTASKIEERCFKSHGQWLGALSQLGHSSDEFVESFDRVESYFGREWIDQRMHPGTHSLFAIFSMGRLLGSLEGVANGEALVKNLRDGKPKARSEATALYLLRYGDPMMKAEYEPPIVIGNRNAVPDFRLRMGSDEPWTYVEVSEPDSSDAQKEVAEVVKRLAAIGQPTVGNGVLQVALRRSPSQTELDGVLDRVRVLASQNEDREIELPADLGNVAMTVSDPHNVPELHVGPAVRSAGVMLGPDGPGSRFTVAIAHADARAEAKLKTEARQLPKDSPGLVMFEMSGAFVGLSRWPTDIANRLARDHTRVSAVCLFLDFSLDRWITSATLVENARATFQLPEHLKRNLTRWPTIQDALQGRFARGP